jgi:hypothetical protein
LNGEAEAQTLCRKVPQGPRSALRFGGDDIVLDGFFLRSVLVIRPAHQTAVSIVIGRFVASSPDFLWKSAAERREADLTHQFAHKQSKLALGVGSACA